MGQARYFLSIEIAHSPNGLLSQHKYIMDILQETGLMDAKPTLFPMNKGLRLDDTTCDLLTTPDKYKKNSGQATLPQHDSIQHHLHCPTAQSAFAKSTNYSLASSHPPSQIFTGMSIYGSIFSRIIFLSTSSIL